MVARYRRVEIRVAGAVLGAGPGKTRRCRCSHRQVSLRAAPDEPESGRAGIDVQPGHAEGMVMVPEGCRGLGVFIGEEGRAGNGIGVVRLAISATRAGHSLQGYCSAAGKPPGLGVAVAVRLHVGAVDMGHERNRAGVGSGDRGLAVGPVVGHP